MTDSNISATAERLYRAYESREPTELISEGDKSFGISDAYLIQRELISRFASHGTEPRGLKIGGMGYTGGKPGVFHFGALLGSRIFHSGETADVNNFFRPGLEAEVAVRLKAPLKFPAAQDDIFSSLGELMPAFEIVDSRYLPGNKLPADSIADNASSGGCFIGSPVPFGEPDDEPISVRVFASGKAADIKFGAITRRQIVKTLSLLAGMPEARGIELCAGDIIITGAMSSPLLRAAPGIKYDAKFTSLGNVTAEFIGERSNDA